MATDRELTELYVRLRWSFLSRHFALGRYFRANRFSGENTLDAVQRRDDFLSRLAADREVERWNITSHGENPLLQGSQLLACIAVEEALGHPHAQRILLSAVRTLRSLYKFRGNGFDGYPIRWDASLSRMWAEDGQGRPTRCREFLVDREGRYIYCLPGSDPRHAPFRARNTLDSLLGVRGGKEYFENQWSGREPEYFERYRRFEPSMDEIVGLVATYAIVHQLTGHTGVRSEIERQARQLGDYLADHGYLLVRPTGGLAARGATGILPALEFPLSRALARITGGSFDSRADFQRSMEKAGYWNCLADPLFWATVAGLGAGAVLAPFIGAILAPLGLLGFVPQAMGMAGGAPVSPLPQILVNVAVPLLSIQIARAWAVYEHRDVFDVQGDTQAGEVAVAFFLKEYFSPQVRLQGWMWGAGFAGKPGTNPPWSVGFPPYLALAALDDGDRTIADAYLGWLSERRHHPDLDPPLEWAPFAQGCFASAVAALVGGGPAEESRLKQLLDERYQQILIDPTTAGMNGRDLRIQENFEEDGRVTHMSEPCQPALDFLSGLALAWLHAKRRADAGNPVRTPGFPALPQNIAFWQPPSVPKCAVDAANLGKIRLPLSALQQRTQPRIDGDQALLFETDNPPSKAEAPPAGLPPSHPDLQADHWFTLRESTAELYTGIVLEDGDEYEFNSTGEMWAGVTGTGTHGPNGWDGITWDARFPLYGSLDPVHAHPFCVLGRFNGGYFFIGQHRPRERYLKLEPAPIRLRVNDPAPGNGTGEFRVRVRVWGRPRTPAELRVTCIRRARGRIVELGGDHPGGWHWWNSASGVIAEIETGHVYYVQGGDGDRAQVIVSIRNGRKYLTTRRGGGTGNNLSSLPRCQA